LKTLFGVMFNNKHRGRNKEGFRGVEVRSERSILQTGGCKRVKKKKPPAIGSHRRNHMQRGSGDIKRIWKKGENGVWRKTKKRSEN